MQALTVDAVVENGKVRICDEDSYKVRAARMAKKWGDGCALVVRIEPQDEGVRYGQMKFFHGYVLEPLVNYTGDHDWRVWLKAMFLPDGKHSLTELTTDEMKVFIERSEQWARQHCPEAYEQYGKEYLG